jgi:Asp-tRNA(Asn)/Glu-tRNA(Gln) amidotransferase A subunit family amidase
LDSASLAALSATDAARLIREGALWSEELVEACLDRARDLEPQVQAWQFLDREYALAQARAADEHKRSGNPVGPLHGVPVGVKDIIDTADMPTENGTVLHAGRAPRHDAAVIERLRAAGAVILGKTVTTEFATYAPGKTRNPHNPEHTPGGSSSGSAAAVAAGMVPLALGTQTNGSVIRPAAFCGVVGFKPSFGLISRHGILRQSPTLDQVGVFARSVEDAALLAQELAGHDARDPASRPRAKPPLHAVAMQEPPIAPMIGFVKSPLWDKLDDEARQAFTELVEHLGDRVEEVEMLDSASEALDWHRCIMEAEMALSLEADWQRGRDRMSSSLRAQIERGREVRALDYQRAMADADELAEGLRELFEQRYDALLTPAALGAAPRGLASTGDPAPCTIWTLCGMPALNLPLLQGSGGLPIGVQLVGARDADARLLRTARWLERAVQAA